MLHIRNLTKSFGAKVLFEDAEAHLSEKSRVALIGPNGAGKSTMIKLILGEDHADTGDIQKRRHMKIGHLAQELPKFENRTIFEEVMRLDGRREEVLKQKDDIEALLATDPSEDNLNWYSHILQEFEAFDEYRLPSRAEQILEGVGFQKKDFGRNLSELSGGWLMRVALGRVLLLQPDLLILDEPTNHLDLESLLWLEEFLRNYAGALLLVSHDRAFVNRLVSEVWEIDQHRINLYAGNLDAYVVQRQERLRVMEAEFAGQQAKIADIKAFVARFGAKASKARQAQSRMKQLEKLEDDLTILPDSHEQVAFRFPACPPSGKEVITLKNGGIRFGEKTIFTKFDWILQRGSRVAIVGVNGAGKTTLLKALSHTTSLSEGTMKHGHQVQIGYYSQLQAESLDHEKTIYEELEASGPKLTISEIRGIAGAFLFHGDAVYKKIKVLSGGEKARVALAKLLLLPNNFLLLDEPTNHLDAESRDVLLNALLNYEGTLVLVSHDRDFVAPLVDQLLEIQDQRVTPLVLNYEEYLAKKTQEAREKVKKREMPGKLSAPGSNGKVPSENAPAETPSTSSPGSRSKPSNNQTRAWQKEFEKTEKDITQLDQRQSELNTRLSTEDFSKNTVELKTIIEEQTRNQAELDQKMNRWEELSSLLGS
jgi:ATP-binding cassette subfamily F protein 3